MAYCNLEQVYEQGLNQYPLVTNVHSVSEYTQLNVQLNLVANEIISKLQTFLLLSTYYS